MTTPAHTTVRTVRTTNAFDLAARVGADSRVTVVYARRNGTTTVSGKMHTVAAREDDLWVQFRRDDGQIMWVDQDNQVHTDRAMHSRVGSLVEATIENPVDPLPLDPRECAPVSRALLVFRGLSRRYPARPAKNFLDAIEHFEAVGGTPDSKNELVETLSREKERLDA